MGCDIHFYVEKKQADGSWKIHGSFNREEDDDGDWISQTDECLYSDRSYDLFAILADVRNGRGFAGIKTGEGFNPISDPRGIPNDASHEYCEIVEQWGCDGHSHSYHTLRQLLDFDWTQTTTCQGWCGMESYLPWAECQRRGSSPKSYYCSIVGGGIEHLGEDDAAKLVEQFKALDWDGRKEFIQQHQGKYALAKWNPTYYYCAGSFITTTIPELLKLAGGTSGLDDLRIVFFFDN